MCDWLDDITLSSNEHLMYSKNQAGSYKKLQPRSQIKILNLLFYPAFASIQNDLSSMDV